MDYLKAELTGKNKWRVLAIPFGGPLTPEAVAKLGIKRPDNGIGFDSDGEFFSKNTDIKPDWFDRRPLVWHHNMDATMKADPVIGTADDLEEEDDGWWATVWLDRQHRYFDRINDLLGAGKMFGSSGSLPNFVKTDPRTGEIKVWPYIEQTFTPTPSNIFSTVRASKAIDHFDEAKIGLSPALRGILSDLDSPTADLRPDLSTPGELPVAQSGGDLGTGGDDAAIQRLVGAVARLEELIKKI
jgi:hypothetical protein